MDRACAVRRSAYSLPVPGPDDVSFMANYDWVGTLDFLQHQPIGESPLFSLANLSPKQFLMHQNSVARTGHKLWQTVDTVLLLNEQFRFSTATPGGKALWDLVQQMWSTDPRWATDSKWAYDTAADMLEVINSRVVTASEMPAFLARCPKAIVLRNELKPALNRYLIQNHAQQLGQRIILWRARDTGKNGRRLSQQVLHMLDQQPPSKTGGMPTYMAFFPGCHYVFEDSQFPDLCWVNNLCCTGVSILLSPDEPPDDPRTPFRLLQSPPISICVRPDGTTLGKLFPGNDVPVHCLPVSKKSQTFTVGYT